MKTYDASGLIEIKQLLNQREDEFLSPIATRSRAAVRRVPEAVLENGYRQAFSADVDRIMHSKAYARYIDKTQVFYLIANDHITHRVLHVQLVSKIARSIGRFLGLNEDLIEAISLGHDIGHTPFGHDGERFLSELCRREGIGHFCHNVQSVEFLDRVERRGKGWNLCLQTLDGILCHDGEVHDQALEPQRGKTFATLRQEMAAKVENSAVKLFPMTLEGCVVRIADTISYIGRDIEDAIRLDMIKREELPRQSVRCLGDTNGTIVFRLVTDIIGNSFRKTAVGFSPEISNALKALKNFNLERIYLNPEIKQHSDTIKRLFEYLFDSYLDDLETGNRESGIFTNFLKDKSEGYVLSRRRQEIVRDFIAGMTDRYFLQQCPPKMRPTMPVQR